MYYSKIVRQVACKMALLSAFMFAACSNDDTTQPTVAHEGGYTEETAFLENIKVVAHARRVAPNEDSSLNELVSSVKPGSIIKMSELDSVTFDTTGNSYITRCLDSTGMFSFDSVSLKSPYVMLELAPYNENDFWTWNGKWSFEDYDSRNGTYVVMYRLIVDLRQSKNVSINAVTFLESYRIQYLMEQGNDFQTAKEQADKELLKALGIYGAPFRFDREASTKNQSEMLLADFLSIFIEAWLIEVPASLFANTFGSTGSLSAVDSIKDYFVNEILYWNRSEQIKQAVRYWNRFEWNGDEPYWNELEWSEDDAKKLLSNFMASLYGLGECGAENNGDSTTLSYDQYRNINFICQEEKWSYSLSYIIPDNIDVSFGLMTDSRDEKNYHTATYNIEGETQTWLTENLKYKSTDGNYTWQDAMDLPDSIALASYEECLEEYTYKECDIRQAENDRLSYKRIWAITDSVKASGKTYQGICPEGWHLPDAYEWKKLRDYVTEKIDIKSVQNLDVMAMAGFGESGEEEVATYVVKIDSSFKEDGYYWEYPGSTLTLVQIKGSFWNLVSQEQPYWETEKASRSFKNTFFVRCIKD